MSTLTGTWALIRLALRRDRIRLPVWIVLFAGMAAVAVAATAELYPTAADQRAMVDSINSV
ncbi:MAG TPA: ABC transporter permease, partial [Amycolatopsis sp.]|nr:ABC transporter permease [Amycolatopsis sp.]